MDYSLGVSKSGHHWALNTQHRQTSEGATAVHLILEAAASGVC